MTPKAVDLDQILTLVSVKEVGTTETEIGRESQGKDPDLTADADTDALVQEKETETEIATEMSAGAATTVIRTEIARELEVIATEKTEIGIETIMLEMIEIDTEDPERSVEMKEGKVLSQEVMSLILGKES